MKTRRPFHRLKNHEARSSTCDYLPLGKVKAASAKCVTILSIKKLIPTVSKMQKKWMTSKSGYASFSPQNRQGVEIPAEIAVKSWEDQIVGAFIRSRRKRQRVTRKFLNKAHKALFFFAFITRRLAESNLGNHCPRHIQLDFSLIQTLPIKHNRSNMPFSAHIY